MLANIATPFGNAIVTAAIARYGDSAVAGYAVIGRIVPLAFGAIFALAGSIGPILGQNFGAGRFDRVRAHGSRRHDLHHPLLRGDVRRAVAAARADRACSAPPAKAQS